MSTGRGRVVVSVGVGLSLLLLGGLGGMALDRMRFEPERADFLARVDAVVRANQGAPLAVGPDVGADTPR